MDLVFKALADPSRRLLLDRLHEQNGQTLGQLCGHLGMARQSVTQHLDLLEAANLISTVRRGREKLHYLNPVPLHEIQDRWIDKFEQPRLAVLSTLKRRAEEAMPENTAQNTPGAMPGKPSFVYVVYIESTPEQVWHALTDADLTARYWGHSNVSDGWRPGSGWEHRRTDGSGIADVVGLVLVSDPPRRLVTTWGLPPGSDSDGDPDLAAASRVTFEIEPYGGIVRLTVTHQGLRSDSEFETAAHGWAAVLSNLKSLLETGHPLPQAPWQMPVSRG